MDKKDLEVRKILKEFDPDYMASATSQDVDEFVCRICRLFEPDQAKPQDADLREQLTDELLNFLYEIRKEEGIHSSDKAFIADCLAPKLLAAGYRKCPKRWPVIHADGCTTNLGVIGAACNCGATGQRDACWEACQGKEETSAKSDLS